MIAFGQSPPLYARPAGSSARPPAHTPSEPPSSSFSAQNPLHRRAPFAAVPKHTLQQLCRCALQNGSYWSRGPSNLDKSCSVQPHGCRLIPSTLQAVWLRLWQPYAAGTAEQQQLAQQLPVGPCCRSQLTREAASLHLTAQAQQTAASKGGPQGELCCNSGQPDML